MRAPTPVKVELVRRAISQTEFARSIGRHPVFVNKVLNGREDAGPETRQLICTALGMPESELFPEQVA